MEEITTFECPECPASPATLELLGVHLERHAPMGEPRWAKRKKCTLCKGVGCRGCSHRKREVLTETCPEGCGRYFPKRNGTLNLNFKQHLRLCDGSKPLRSSLRKGTPKLSGGRASVGPVRVAPTIEAMVYSNGKL